MLGKGADGCEQRRPMTRTMKRMVIAEQMTMIITASLDNIEMGKKGSLFVYASSFACQTAAVPK
jgi:hypothetical protein